MMRADVALHRAGMARSRTHAQRIIAEGRAYVDGVRVSKPSHPVESLTSVAVSDVPDGLEYASRAAHKLAGALHATGVRVHGKRCADIGASTGGFTDILLRSQAGHVAAIDIGHGQLDPRLAADPRVSVYDDTSIRGLRACDIGGPVDLAVSDLSFISLTLVMEEISALVHEDGEAILMVKPQFEVGRAKLGKNGVVSDPALHREAVVSVAGSAAECGMRMMSVHPSQLPGQEGNREFFLHLQRGPAAPLIGQEQYGMIEEAVHSHGLYGEGDRVS